jgi:ABC-type nitrate/sulfonate/bicarbonate transport system permease component
VNIGGAVRVSAASRKNTFRSKFTYFAVLAGAFAIWQLLSLSHTFPSFALPSPEDVYHAVVTTTTVGYLSATLQQDLLISLYRVGVAFVGAVLIGIVIGVAMTESRLIFRVVDPFLQFLRPIPPLAYIPLFVIWFGIGELPKILLILVAAAPVTIINTISGVRSTPQQRIEIAKNLGANRFQVLYRVVLPSALPEILTGMRVAIGVAWSTLVAAELIAAKSGLGWLVEEAGTELQTPIVITGILSIGLVGYLMDLSIRLLERALVPWRGHV